MNRQIILISVLVVLVGVSVYVWSTTGVETDEAQESVVEAIHCRKCGHQWEMSIREQKKMLQEGDGKGFLCPGCNVWGESAPEGEDGGIGGSFLGSNTMGNTDDEDEEEEDITPSAPQGMQKADP